MTSVEQGDHSLDSYTTCWLLWTQAGKDEAALLKSIDRIFSAYSFYPEIEWSKYGYRPPENYSVLGAWRDPQGQVFAFLLDNQSMVQPASSKQAILYVSGPKEDVVRFDARINELKTGLARAEKKELTDRHADRQLKRVEESKLLRRLVALVGLFTVIVNSLSLYLRSFPPPQLPSLHLSIIYQVLVGAIHFSALFLLLVVMLIGIGFAVRYGLLLLRRL